MATLTLHPINHGFPNDMGLGKETWLFEPQHLPNLLRGEYRFLRVVGGCDRFVARWHCHRMIAMMRSNWIAERVEDDLADWEWEDVEVEDATEDDIEIYPPQ